jgi:OOP family OmpA-OmpF porin
MKRVLLLAVAAASLAAGAATHAASSASGWYLSPEALGVAPDNVFDSKTGAGWRVAAGKALSERWDAELAYSQTQHNPNASSKSGKLTLNDAELNFKRIIDRDQRVSPFIEMGVGLVSSKFPTTGKYTAVGGKFGAGALVTLGNVASSPLRLVADAGLRFDPVRARATAVDPYVGLGLRYTFGRAAAPAPVVAPPAPPAATPPPPPPPPPAAAPRPTPPPVADTDSDRDGVVDRLDRCPDTPLGDKVDSNGCSLTMNLHINFDHNSAVIKPAAAQELDRFVAFLKDVPSAKGELQGHTDSTGTAAYNLKLSQRRADAALKYVTSRGIAASRVTIKGYGQTKPIADNKTAQGREQNRRVVFERSGAR